MDVALYCGSVPAVAWSVAPAYFFRELAEARSIIYDYFISVNYAIKFPNGEFRSCSLRSTRRSVSDFYLCAQTRNLT